MEVIREVALAYYHHLSEDGKRKAYQVFRGMDSNGDGTITVDEWVVNASNDAEACRIRSMFRELDTNGDGKLDFDEFVTLFYISKSQIVGCDGIGCKKKFMTGLYFTCVECFNHSIASFDLCASCFRYDNFVHAHHTFLDNHSLYRSNAEYNRAQVQVISPEQPSQVKRSGSTKKVAMKIGVEVGSQVAQQIIGAACTIM